MLTKVKRALSRRRDDSDDQPTPKATAPPPIDTTRGGSQDVLGGPYETISPNASPSAAQFEDIYRGDKSKSERGRKGLPGLLSRFTSSSSIPSTSPIVNSSKRSNDFLKLPPGMNGDEDEDGSKTPTTTSDSKQRGTIVASPTEAHSTDEKAVYGRMITAEQGLQLVKGTAALISERGERFLEVSILKPLTSNPQASRPSGFSSLIGIPLLGSDKRASSLFSSLHWTNPLTLLVSLRRRLPSRKHSSRSFTTATTHMT